jgi:hypothetical protein
VIPLFDALRAVLPSRDEVRGRAASLTREARDRAAQLARDVADSETTARVSRALDGYRDRWERSRLRVDPAFAKQLLKVVEEETFPGVAPLRTTVFDEAACPFCKGLHSRKCPAVKEIEYGPGDGRTIRVTYFEHWSDKDVLWREDLEVAAARDGDAE